MEKLTGKCKADFKAYHSNSKNQFKLNNIEFKDLPCIVQNALIIEFFDSVGIKIGIDPVYDMQGTYRAYIGNFGFQSMYRNVAVENATIKANELYNSKK